MKYKNISDHVQEVPSAGVWQPGEVKESAVELLNSNFELVDGAPSQPVQPVTTTQIPPVLKAVETNPNVPGVAENGGEETSTNG
jgi:hypothetical protein